MDDAEYKNYKEQKCQIICLEQSLKREKALGDIYSSILAEFVPLAKLLGFGTCVTAGVARSAIDLIQVMDGTTRSSSAPERALVPLGIEDIQPGSTIRIKTGECVSFMCVVGWTEEKVLLPGYSSETYKKLFDSPETFQINIGGKRCQKGHLEWNPCSKIAN